MTIHDLWQTLQIRREADFLVLPGLTVTYGQMQSLVLRWLARFDALRLVEGNCILIRTANEPAAISAFLAALLDGVVPVMQVPDTPDSRTLSVAQLADATMLVADEQADAAPLSTELPQVTVARIHDASVGGAEGTRDLVPGLPLEAAARAPRLPTDPDGPAYLLFTSGTTSSPAGVQITRANLCANLTTLSRLFGYDAHSRIFNDMILAHADGLVQGPLLALANGCATVRAGGFRLGDLEDWLNRVRQEHCSHVITVPTIWAMIDAYAARDDYFEAPECRALLSVAAKIPDQLWTRLETRFKRPLFNQYGLTETVASATYAGPHPEMGARFTVGKPVDCEARISSQHGECEGELELRGDNVFPGYWRNAERTAETFTADGWMKTGDLARREPDGSYSILGRLKTVIMSGGFLIRPDEIDEAMVRHPAVRESATVAIEDEMFGEVPVTAVVCATPVAENELTAHARAALENQKVPKRIIALDAIPRGDAGKAQVRKLHDILLAEMASHETRAADAGPANVAAEVIAVAADVFRVDPGTLTLDSQHGEIAGWDSFSHLILVMEVEQRYSIAIPANRIAALRTLGDMVRTVEELAR